MGTGNLPEVWLRGPLPKIPPTLQPIAHALLQAAEEINEVTKDFPRDLLWKKPAGAASVGFHLQHIRGVLDRLFTYARGEGLSELQFRELRAEGIETDEDTTYLAARLQEQIKKAVNELESMNEANLSSPRAVGRAQLPSTVIGLLFHAAEHTMRHVGQLLVTAKVLLNKPS